ncbi:MAG: 50S ribosomal protein L23 [Nanoarchaeota archaeon]|nr:50S ribosomal protein L23 [Nanoarchaeota archaeon]
MEGVKYIISVKGGEKAMKLLQTENKISFIVRPDSNKTVVAKEVERLFSVKVEKVNVLNDPHGNKIAIVKLSKGYNSMDIATKLGML